MVDVKTYAPIELKPLLPHALDVLHDGLSLLKNRHCWISSGTLLGLYRDKKLIPHDTDLDVNVLDSPTIKLPYQLIRTIHYQGLPMQTAYIHRGVIFDIYYFYSKESFAVNFNDGGRIEKPFRFLEPNTYECNGYTYPVPSNVDDFLTWRFGEDWRTPKTSKEVWTADAHHLIKE